MADQDEPNTPNAEQTPETEAEPRSTADVAVDEDVVEAHVWRAQS